VAFIDRSSRVGRSQGASIFWGLVSVFFAAAACFYYFQDQKNENSANQMRDTVLQLREQNESLNSEKDNLQATKAEAESQLKAREDLVEQKENQLANEEVRLESLGQQATSLSPQNLAQVTAVKKFNDLIRKLSKDNPPDVVERGGRPVLRIPNATLFAPGDATLKPEGKTLLTQIGTSLNDQLDTFELRIVSYTDSDAEATPAPDAKKDAPPAAAPDAKNHATASWDLTAARAAAIAHFYRDQTQVPFLNVLVVGRGDSEPIASNTGDNHARNRRVEITIAPLPVAYHPPDSDKPAATAAAPAPAPATKPAASTDTPPAVKKIKKVDKPSTH
jgi:chemotaxis protein MotB